MSISLPKTIADIPSNKVLGNKVIAGADDEAGTKPANGYFFIQEAILFYKKY